MVKPVFETLNKMREAASGEDALDIGVAFLRSADALHVDDGRAGTFVKQLKTIFAQHQTPDLEEVLLGIAVAEDSKVSFGLRTSSTFALTDLRSEASYKRDAHDVLISNARVLKGFKEADPTGFQFATHYASPAADMADTQYPELHTVTNAADLKLAINHVLSENDITDDVAADFFIGVIESFKALKISPHDQVELLSFIQDGVSAHSKIYNLAVEGASQIINETEGPAPRINHTGGGSFDLGMK